MKKPAHMWTWFLQIWAPEALVLEPYRTKHS